MMLNSASTVPRSSCTLRVNCSTQRACARTQIYKIEGMGGGGGGANKQTGSARTQRERAQGSVMHGAEALDMAGGSDRGNYGTLTRRCSIKVAAQMPGRQGNGGDTNALAG